MEVLVGCEIVGEIVVVRIIGIGMDGDFQVIEVIFVHVFGIEEIWCCEIWCFYFVGGVFWVCLWIGFVVFKQFVEFIYDCCGKVGVDGGQVFFE